MYTGTVPSGATIKIGDEDLEVMFFPNKEVNADLPEDNEYIKGLVFNGLLTPIVPAKKAKTEAKNGS